VLAFVCYCNHAFEMKCHGFAVSRCMKFSADSSLIHKLRQETRRSQTSNDLLEVSQLLPCHPAARFRKHYCPLLSSLVAL
jgi:hypothetical protein